MVERVLFRFDVDTTKCMQVGVPALLDFAKEEGVRFTFFVNMGRAVAYGNTLKSVVAGKRRRRENSVKLSVPRKLGLAWLLETLLLNKNVGLGSTAILKRALKEGHDVQLHGGTNHGAWIHDFYAWDKERIRREVEWGVEAFSRELGQFPYVFSAPGWASSDVLLEILGEFGMRGSADRHGVRAQGVIVQEDVVLVPTHFCGEPGGVGYFEHLVASGREKYINWLAEWDEEARVDGQSFMSVYDHPAFAGGEGLVLLQMAVGWAKSRNMEFATFKEIVEDQL